MMMLTLGQDVLVFNVDNSGLTYAGKIARINAQGSNSMTGSTPGNADVVYFLPTGSVPVKLAASLPILAVDQTESGPYATTN